MKYVRSLSELADDIVRVIVRRALKNQDTREMLASSLYEELDLETEMEKAASSAAEEAADSALHEWERDRERNGITSGDMSDFNDAVDERIDRAMGTPDFDQAVKSVVEEHTFDADDVEDLDKFVENQINETIVDLLVENIDESNVEKLRSALRIKEEA